MVELLSIVDIYQESILDPLSRQFVSSHSCLPCERNGFIFSPDQRRPHVPAQAKEGYSARKSSF
jgi:hypothetical protein